MIVFFDVLVLDDQPVLRHCLQDRRAVLRDLVRVIPGRSMRSEWTLLDFKTGEGTTDLKQAFARSIADRQEGLLLKPLHAPYFALLSDKGHRKASFFVKMKRDYLSDMGGERDLGDFAVVGASFDAQVAPKTSIRPLHWTHFYLGCCTNRTAVQRAGAKPRFKVVASLSLDKCIPKPDVKYMNIQGYVRQAAIRDDGSCEFFEIEQSRGFDRRMTVAFKQPFVAEVLGGGFEKLQNETFEMLRHPRVKKIHHDRTWKDTVTMEDLEQMAEEKWEVPDSDKLDGHAKDVALLVKKYMREDIDSQGTVTTKETTQETTQQTTSEATPLATRHLPTDAIISETQEHSSTTVSTSTCSPASSTHARGVSASCVVRSLVREDTSERLKNYSVPLTVNSTADSAQAHSTKRSFTALISPPTSKRRRVLSPLTTSRGNRHLGTFDFDSQDQTIHIYVKESVKVKVHTRAEVHTGVEEQR